MYKKYSLFILIAVIFTNFNLKAQTQMEMTQTAHNDFKKADAKLNKVYKQVLKILTEKEKQLLIKAQKDWLKFRDSQCQFEVEQYNGGSIQPLMHANCLKERTKDRIDDLKAILEDEER